MNPVLLGVGLGLATIIPPGPVSLTLVQVGARQGRPSALRGALGVATGDVVLAVIAVAIVGAGAGLPGPVFQTTQIVAAAALVMIGIALGARPEVASASIGRITRPGRTLFLLTSLTPSALGAWVAMLAAVPYATDPRQLALFAVGVVFASFVWHPALGAAASGIGSRLSERGQTQLSRAGGIIMIVLGTALMTPHVL